MSDAGMLSFCGKYGHWFGLALLLVLAGAISFDRARRNCYDFHHFYIAAEYVWQHGELNPDLDNPDKDRRRELPFYLPVVSLLLAPVAFGGLEIAAGLWAVGQMMCLALALRVLLEWCRADQETKGPALLFGVACLLAVPAVWETAKFNQLSFLVLALLLGAFSTLEKGQRVRAGALFGLAAVVKLLPAIFAVWLLMKRQWKALGAFAATVALVALLPPLAIFGPQKTLAYHREWLAHNVHGPPAGGMADGDLEGHFIDRRNQALTVVCARLFSPEHPHRAAFQPLELSTDTSVWLARAILVVLGLGLLWRTRQPWGALKSSEPQAEFATYLLGMMAFSPLLRQYYLVWALPAVVVFLRLVAGPAGGRPRKIGKLGIMLWLLGMLAWMWRPARVCGAHWLMLAAMGVLLLAAFAHGPAPADDDEPAAERPI